MSFSGPNQLLVSRAYYDVVSCLSVENPEMFHYIGIHNDKHVREHAVYEVVSSKDGIQSAAMFHDLSDTATGRLTRQTGIDLDARIVQNVQEQLALIIGPMAGVLLKRAMKQSSSLDQLFELLAEEIPTEAEKARFLASKDRLH
jgi:hypothetical protein